MRIERELYPFQTHSEIRTEKTSPKADEALSRHAFHERTLKDLKDLKDLKARYLQDSR